jgi:hypothetical protein
MKSIKPQSVVLLCGGLWILWGFGFETMWARYATDVEGTVISSRDVPSKGAPRYITEYIIRSADGHDHQYVAGPTDASLDRSIPIGSQIQKKWGQLGYEVNGQWHQFPLYAYSATFGVAFFAIFWAALLQRRS